MTALDALWVGLGGGLGSLMPWWVGRAVGERWRGDFPLRTLLINISGAFPMGYLSVLLAVDWHTRHGTALTALCLTGIIGGYTTFSSMQMDAVKLAGTRGHVRAASYLGLSVPAGLLAAALGGALASCRAEEVWRGQFRHTRDGRGRPRCDAARVRHADGAKSGGRIPAGHPHCQSPWPLSCSASSRRCTAGRSCPTTSKYCSAPASWVALVISIWQYWWGIRYLWGDPFTPIAGVTKEGKQTPIMAVAILLIGVGLLPSLRCCSASPRAIEANEHF